MFLPRRSVLFLGSVVILVAVEADGQVRRNVQEDRPKPGALVSRFRDPCGHDPVDVLIRPPVGDELKLSDEQKNEVRMLIFGHVRRHSEAIKAIRKADGADPEQVFAQREWYHDEGTKVAATVLTPGQRERLEQIFLQIEGPIALARREPARKLGLSDKQSRQVKAAVLELLVTQERLWDYGNSGRGGGYPPEQEYVNGRNLRAEAGAVIGRVLTKDQKTAFNAMLGEPFDLSKLDPLYPPLPARRKREKVPSKKAG